MNWTELLFEKLPWGGGGLKCCLAFYVSTRKSLYDLRGSERNGGTGCEKMKKRKKRCLGWDDLRQCFTSAACLARECRSAAAGCHWEAYADASAAAAPRDIRSSFTDWCHWRLLSQRLWGFFFFWVGFYPVLVASQGLSLLWCSDWPPQNRKQSFSSRHQPAAHIFNLPHRLAIIFCPAQLLMLTRMLCKT